MNGYRYVVEFPMGYESAQFVSKKLYPTQGHAIDAMREAYPEDEYPDAKRSIMEDDEGRADHSVCPATEGDSDA